jgi:hypothetical protein
MLWGILTSYVLEKGDDLYSEIFYLSIILYRNTIPYVK